MRKIDEVVKRSLSERKSHFVDLKPVQEASELLGVSRATLDRLVKAGKLASYDRHGDRRVFVDMDEAREVLKFRRRDGEGSGSNG